MLTIYLSYRIYFEKSEPIHIFVSFIFAEEILELDPVRDRT